MKKPTHRLFRDLTGQRFGRLLVSGYAGRIDGDHAFQCECDCGGTIRTRGYSLTGGQTRSCGCLLAIANKTRLTTHGHAGSAIWRIWSGMKTRCFNPKTKSFARYGDSGITVCDRWVYGEDGKTGFECFLADMGPRPSSEHSIDRYPDPFGNYEPSNCRWATRNQQAQNTKAASIVFNGERHSAHEWAKIVNLPADQILKRLGRGWSVERSLTQPLRKGQNS